MTYGMKRISPVRLKENKRLKAYLGVFCVTVFLLFYLSAHVVILSLEEKVRTVQKKQSEVTGEITTLEIEIAGLKKGSRIKKIAHECLGLEMPVGAPAKLF